MKKIKVKIDGCYKAEIEWEQGLDIDQVCTQAGIERSLVMLWKYDNQPAEDKKIPQVKELDLLTIHSSEGNGIRMNTTIFVMLKAFHNCFNGQYKVIVEHSIGDGVYCEVFGDKVFMKEDNDRLHQEMRRIIDLDLQISREVYNKDKAIAIFSDLGRKDVLPLLNGENIVYECGKFTEMLFAPVARTTGTATEFDLYYHSPGFILRYPRQGYATLKPKFKFPKGLFSAHQEHDKWLGIIKLHMVNALNEAVKDVDIKDKIQIEEALHERKLVHISDEICANKDLKLVLIAGPSSSGKTTFSKRLAIQLIVNGIKPLQISLDDYFMSHERTPRKADGEFDFENIEAIDLERLNHDLAALLAGETVELPKYDFHSGTSHKSGRKITMGENDLLVIEGIHGLNDILTQSIPFQQKARIYVSALNNLNLDEHNRISTTDCRRIRRMVRDSKFRGITPEETLMRWDDIREGEEKYIFPYQENADYMFNSILTYELGVMRPFARPKLQKIEPDSCVYSEARRLLRIFDFISEIGSNYVPANSIIREFIGGSIFEY